MRTRLVHIAALAGAAAVIALTAGCDTTDQGRSDAGAQSGGTTSGQATTSTGARPTTPTGGAATPDAPHLGSAQQQASAAQSDTDLADGEYPVYIKDFVLGPDGTATVTVDVIQFFAAPDLPPGDDGFEVYRGGTGLTYYLRNDNPRLRTLHAIPGTSVFNVVYSDYHEMDSSDAIPTSEFNDTYWETESGKPRPWIITVRDGAVNQIMNAT